MNQVGGHNSLKFCTNWKGYVRWVIPTSDAISHIFCLNINAQERCKSCVSQQPHHHFSMECESKQLQSSRPRMGPLFLTPSIAQTWLLQISGGFPRHKIAHRTDLLHTPRAGDRSGVVHEGALQEWPCGCHGEVVEEDGEVRWGAGGLGWEMKLDFD